MNFPGKLLILWGDRADAVPGLIQVFLSPELCLAMAPLSSAGWWFTQPIGRGSVFSQWGRELEWDP